MSPDDAGSPAGPEISAGSAPSTAAPDSEDSPITRLDGLRVAVINWRDPWQDVAGGAEEYAWQLSRQLLGRGAAVHFVTSRQPGQPRRDAREGVTIRRMGGTFTRYPYVLAWLLAHRNQFDVVIDCMNGIPFFSPLVLPRRVPVVCVVHHVHDQQFFVHFPAWLANIGKLLEGPVARRVYRRHLVAAVSPSTVTAMRDRLRWDGRIHVVPNGTPVARTVDPDALQATGDPAIICVGRLSAHKRVERIVDLAGRLRDRWPGIKVHIVGRGAAYEPLAARVAEQGLEDHVQLHGFLSAADKNSLLATARLHVSASQFEGWGLSVMEAASLGVPTVAYDVDGLRDAVCDGVTGWLATDGEELADVVDRTLKELSDPVRAAEVRADCVAWAGSFTWTTSGERMARLLVTELDAARAAPRTRTGSARRGGHGGPVGSAYVVHYGPAEPASAVPGPAAQAPPERESPRQEPPRQESLGQDPLGQESPEQEPPAQEPAGSGPGPAVPERVALVEDTDPARLYADASERGVEILDLRPATRTELLLGRAEEGR